VALADTPSATNPGPLAWVAERGEYVRAAPTLLVAAAAAGLAWRETGSIAAVYWLPYAIGVALLLTVALALAGGSVPSTAGIVTLAALVALAVWASLSAFWAPVPTLARDEGLLTLFYAAAFAVPLLTLRRQRDRAAALAGVVLVLTASAVGVGVLLLVSDEPLNLFVGGRLQAPVTYSNAQAALSLVGFWPAVLVAAARSRALLTRTVALGGATAMLGGWLATQSKGGAVGLVVSGIVLFALCPARLRLLVPTALAGALAAVAFRPLTEPFRAADDAARTAAIHGAGRAILVLAVVGAAAGVVYALADRRVVVPPRVRRVAGAVVLAALALSLVGGVVAAARAVDSPREFVEERWREARAYEERDDRGTHLADLGSNRYDFYRVAASAFRDRPLVGIGARGFSAEYLQHGRTIETPARVHSLPLEVLAEQGVVGFALLAVALGAALLRAARGALRRRLPAAAALAAGSGWVAHASVDWNWTVPAAALPFFLLVGIACASARGRALGMRPARGAAAVVALLALLVLAPPWLGARLSQRALDDPTTAESDLAWARRLDSVSVQPYLIEARLSYPPDPARARPADWEPAIEPLRRAVAKQPRAAETQYVLGVVLLNAGRFDAARRHLLEAQRLAPRDRFVREAVEVVEQRR